MTNSSLPNLAGQSLDNGRYLIEERLGAGGMGSVWLAMDTRMNTKVVVKIPHTEMLDEPGFKERFSNEIRALIALSQRHGNVVKIFDLGDHNGVPYAVMQYLSGGSLCDLAARMRGAGSGVNIRAGMKWLEQIASSLDFMHRNHIVHRDVKPANILFDEARHAYLADFGIAKLISENDQLMMLQTITDPNQMIGTIAYMPYEVLMGQPVNGMADQFALAVTVYEVLTGRRPFEASTPAAICQKQQAGGFVSISMLNPAIPAPVNDAMTRAFNSDPQQRFADCMSFAMEVLRHIETTATVDVEQRDRPTESHSSSDTTGKPFGVPVEVTAPIAKPNLNQNPNPNPNPNPAPAGPAPVPPTPVPKAKKAPTPPASRPATNMPSQTMALPNRPTSKPTSQPVTPAPGSAGPPQSSPSQLPPPQQAASQQSVSWRKKLINCPWCWQKFSPADILWISEHPSLTGDVRLGPDEAKRFLPTHYTPDGRAIDIMGQVCRRTGCPRCHLLIPRELVDYQSLFISVLGTPSSGKTCFMSAMSWQLRQTLPRNFLYSFVDADPELNSLLIDNEEALFMNRPDQVVKLAKTQEDGVDSGYMMSQLDGTNVQLMRPNVFSLRPTPQHPNHHASRAISYAMCLFDNAGEHFLAAGRKSPVTRHLAQSDALVMVFDPSQHPRFRSQCQNATDDVQFTSMAETYRQETVLIEAMNRIRQYGNLSLHEKHDRPLVVLLNKYDAWAAAFKGKRLRDPWVQSQANFPHSLDVTRIESTSNKMRKVLLKYCPEICNAAEELSHDVTYIPVSSFGRRVEQDKTVRVEGLNPMWAEVPLLYLLSKIRRGVIPRV